MPPGDPVEEGAELIALAEAKQGRADAEDRRAGSRGAAASVKMAVGIADLDDLRRVRAARLAERGGSWVYTRNRPRRAAEVLGGGSIYWVIRGQIRVRQRSPASAANGTTTAAPIA